MFNIPRVMYINYHMKIYHCTCAFLYYSNWSLFEWLFVFLEQSLQNTYDQGVVLVITDLFAIKVVCCVFHVEYDVPL